MSKSFLSRLVSGLDHVKQYEELFLQAKARSLVPVDVLEEKAAKRSKETSSDKRDCLLLELLAWFKRDFFRWCNSPPCDFCGGKTTPCGMGKPEVEELRHQAGRIELYACASCGRQTRFPRYNDPGKLLDTRRGRCGEWANCFTLICRALGFDARHVLDWTDHVWTEVYSEFQKRWLHCDPCENKCDKPLLYEIGWGKKLSYVIAFSKDEVVDVTWRYTAKHEETRSRRKECPESWLVDTIQSLNQQIRKGLSAERVAVLQQRSMVELAEFLTVRLPGGEEQQGRVSGSEAWRRERGELGKMQNESKVGHVFSPSASELANGLMGVCYSPALDVYYSCMSDDVTATSQPCVSGWKSGVYTCKNVFRKEEFDWQMVYLAREEASNEAEISWKFDLKGTGHSLDCVLIKAASTCYENGAVKWRVITSNGKEVSLPLGGDEAVEVIELHGFTSFELHARLSGGRGDVAWQHTQLFRMSTDNRKDFPFEVTLIIKTA